MASATVRRVGLDRLLVLWRQPTDGSRHVIGDLWRDPHGYAFAYRPALPIGQGFALLPEFPEHRTESSAYRARYLFPTFGQRVPSPAREDLRELVRSWGVEHLDDPLEILARSGGVQATDRLELAEYRAEDDQLERPLEMRVAGASHYDDAGKLRAGDPLELRREPTNEHDRCATLVLAKDDHKLGYVPRQYSQMIATLLDAGVVLRAEAVRRLTVRPDGGRWVVRVSRRAT
jgi:hypothetical protein